MCFDDHSCCGVREGAQKKSQSVMPMPLRMSLKHHLQKHTRATEKHLPTRTHLKAKRVFTRAHICHFTDSLCQCLCALHVCACMHVLSLNALSSYLKLVHLLCVYRKHDIGS